MTTGNSGATWGEFEAARPGIAAPGKELLYLHGPGLAYLATIRADGGPRVHPICPHVFDGHLYAFVGVQSPKHRDLVRDGRYALHTFPKPGGDDEFTLMGRAELLDDRELEARIRADLPFDSDGSDPPFELFIERALLSVYDDQNSWPPTYTRWRAP